MTDWAEFYTELYTRLELDDYLPAVLAELAGETVPDGRPALRINASAFVAAANDAIEENQRAYQRAVELSKYADYAQRQYNPWQDES